VVYNIVTSKPHKEDAVNIIDIISKLIQQHEEINGEGAEFTPYAIAELVGDTFCELGSDKAVRTQMMYNYDKAGLIVKGMKNKKRYTAEEAAVFVLRYVHKHIDD
jgi:hypothetical protein